MTNDKPFQPEFGPNGAVLNAPTMTPELRAKYDQAGKIPSLGDALVGMSSLLLVGAGLLFLGWLLIWGRTLMRESPWWSGAVFGTAAALAAGVVWRSVRQGLSRWELMGNKTRVLTAPRWMRILLFVTEVLVIAAYATGVVALVADPNMATGDVTLTMWATLLVLFALIACLKWLAKRRGWVVKPA